MDAIAKESNKKPEIIVFAGPNGSGKSTFTDLLKPPVDYINADEIKKNLKVDCKCKLNKIYQATISVEYTLSRKVSNSSSGL